MAIVMQVTTEASPTFLKIATTPDQKIIKLIARGGYNKRRQANDIATDFPPLKLRNIEYECPRIAATQMINWRL